MPVRIGIGRLPDRIRTMWEVDQPSRYARAAFHDGPKVAWPKVTKASRLIGVVNGSLSVKDVGASALISKSTVETTQKRLTLAGGAADRAGVNRQEFDLARQVAWQIRLGRQAVELEDDAAKLRGCTAERRRGRVVRAIR